MISLPLILRKVLHKRCIVSARIHIMEQNGLVNPIEVIALSWHAGFSTVYFNLLASQKHKREIGLHYCWGWMGKAKLMSHCLDFPTGNYSELSRHYIMQVNGGRPFLCGKTTDNIKTQKEIYTLSVMRNMIQLLSYGHCSWLLVTEQLTAFWVLPSGYAQIYSFFIKLLESYFKSEMTSHSEVTDIYGNKIY